MTTTSERQRNQAAYRQLSAWIAQTYPKGRFLAIAAGQIIADAASFEELDKSLSALGHDSVNVLVVQAGIAYPEEAVIFI